MSVKEISTQTAAGLEEQLGKTLESCITMGLIYRPVCLVPCGHSLDLPSLKTLFLPHRLPENGQPCDLYGIRCPLCRTEIQMYVPNQMLKEVTELFREKMGIAEPVIPEPVVQPAAALAIEAPRGRQRHLGPLPAYNPPPEAAFIELP